MFALGQPALDPVVAVRANVFWAVERTCRYSDQIVTVILEVKRCPAFGQNPRVAMGDDRNSEGYSLGPFQLVSPSLDKNGKCAAGRAFAHVAMAVSAVWWITHEFISPRTAKTAAGPQFAHVRSLLRCRSSLASVAAEEPATAH